jgi:urea transporter
VFFAHSPWVGLLFALAMATEPLTLAFALLAVMVASLVARALNLDGDLRAAGAFGYNALLIGAGIGHLYPGSWLAIPIAILASAIGVVLTAAARAWLTRHMALPALSLPFLAVFWLLTSAAPAVGLSPTIELGTQVELASPIRFFTDYARCLGSIFFLPSVQAGSLMAVALLLHSRIASLLAFSTFALLFAVNAVLPSPLPGSAFAVLAANAVLLSMAIGGVWFVPSRWSAIWACGATLSCMLLAVGLSQPFATLGLPVLFLPFNLTAFGFLLAARERVRDHRPRSVDFLPGSPEENLDYFLNQQVRFPLSHGIRFRLPFRGRWTCSQGIDGEHTHQGPWRYAFDFQIRDDDGRLFGGSPDELGSYHCYRLPVLAAASGVVVKVESDIPDNPIGEMDLVHNWGNVVILQHGPGLYSLVAHLARRSIKVKEGQQIAQGDLLGLCGNSGRSPTPHLHFHLQKAAYLGADTLPIAYCDVVMAASIGERLEISHVPREGDGCRNLEPGCELIVRLCPQPGDTWRMRGNGMVEDVRADLNLLGQTRLQSNESTGLVCTRTEGLLRVHDVVGNSRSVLSLVRAALPRLPLEDNMSLVWKDYVSIHRTPGLSRLAGLAARVVPRPGLAMSYTLHKNPGSLVVEGASFRKNKYGQPLLRTRIAFDADRGPASIEIRYGAKEVRASRIPDHAGLAMSGRLESAEPGEVPTQDHRALGRQPSQLS